MKKKRRSNLLSAMLPYIALGIAFLAMFLFMNGGKGPNELTTGELIQAIKKENVTEIVITPKASEGLIYVEGKLIGYKNTSANKIIQFFKSRCGITLKKKKKTIANAINELRNGSKELNYIKEFDDLEYDIEQAIKPHSRK